ncbi:hypothetical protein AKJ55_01805 [candidate division MSBL1 archaeon SCGC-AAA382M17]|uniref:DUF5673 domain-containing protein n=1 Tax=candidate division MSBL1 archaeon SCGC-AAA382M17 TaxID=1698284 RepID=A0ABR5TJ50_9EURY|nr:hypothetical protein AKJ55_01805 [candidate division MSBL1 archaeon SCGC-AAA382M17]
MERKYNRTTDIYIILLIVGLVVVIDTFRLQNFIWLYDGIKFLIALLVMLLGLWGLFVPYAIITDNTLKINSTIFKIKEFDLNQVTNIEFDDTKDQIHIKDQDNSHSIKLRSIKKKDRAALKTDLNDFKSKEQEK